MRKSKGIAIVSLLILMSCATNKSVVRDCTKSLMNRYRGETKQRIAIFPFMTKSQRKTAELNSLDEEIMDVVFQDRRLQVVERSLVEQISKEWQFSESGMVDEKQRAKIGRLSGAKLILVPIASGRKNISMKIISVNTGDVLSYMRSVLATPLMLNAPVVEPARTDRRQTATETRTISVGSSMNGSISSAGESDRYMLRVRRGSNIEIRANRTDGVFDPIIELSNTRGEFIASDDDGGDGVNARLVRRLSAGRYYVVVRAYQNNVGNYRISVNQASAVVSSSNFGNLMIQLETSVQYSSQTDGWRDRRSSWLSDVRGAGGDLSRMKELLIEFERNILSSGQNSSWIRNSRGNWLRRVRNAGSMNDLAQLLIECESNIRYSAQSDSWRNSRSGWMSQVRAIR